MTNPDVHYADLKTEIGVLANALFELSERFLRKMDNFLPHGALLTDGDEVVLVAAKPNGNSDQATSVEVLPMLHSGLRELAHTRTAKAVAVAENVTITLEGQKPTKAIKVLFEHRRGLTVALYRPFEKKLLRAYSIGAIFTLTASPEVQAWK